MRKNDLRKTLQEGYVNGLKQAYSIISEMARKFDDDTTEWLNTKPEKGLCDRKYYRNSTHTAIPFREDGKTWWLKVERPTTLNTTFCYGYNISRRGEPDDGSYEYANSQVGNESFEQFLYSNINKGNVRYQDTYDLLTKGKARDSYSGGKQQPIILLYSREQAYLAWIPAYLETEDDALKYLQDNNRVDNSSIEGVHIPTQQEKERIIKAYEEVIEDITKRCKTYWKKFGNSKFKSWSYMRD